MLQISIVHEHNKIIVREIKNLETSEILSSFDDNTGKIDFSCLIDEIGKDVLISHFNKNKQGDIEFDYEHVRTISDVSKNDNNYMSFSFY